MFIPENIQEGSKPFLDIVSIFPGSFGSEEIAIGQIFFLQATA